jgi:hypothetical protein
MLVLTGQAHVRQKIVGADQHQVHALDRGDRIGLLQRIRGFELDDHHGRSIHRGVGFGRREGAVMQVRQRAGGRTLAQRRKFRRGHDRARFGGRADMRRDYAERPGVERARHAPAACPARARRAHADGERRHADLAGGVERETAVLDIDVKRIEAGGFGDARDLDAAHQAHGHGSDDFVAREFFLDVVAQEVAQGYRHLTSSFSLNRTTRNQIVLMLCQESSAWRLSYPRARRSASGPVIFHATAL